jgi:hypothetical protein
MKFIRRTTNILVKTKRKFVIRQSSEEILSCGLCGKQMITAQTAALLHDISTRDIYRFVEEGKVHFTETDSKLIFVCSDFGDLIPPKTQLAAPGDNF